MNVGEEEQDPVPVLFLQNHFENDKSHFSTKLSPAFQILYGLK